MEKYNQAKIKKEMYKLISSLCLKKQAVNVFLKSFESFLYIKFNRKYQRYAPFIQSLICIYVDSLKTIIKDLDSIDFYNILFLYNNMTKPLLFKDWITSCYNCALIIVMPLKMLYYA